jgi:hypothetical protein
MTPERQPDIRLTGIHINLVEQVVTLEAEDGRKARLGFSPAGNPLPAEGETLEALVAEDEDVGWQPEPSPVEQRERQQTIVVSGQLRSQPKPGRPDRQGRPTAWARLAVQEAGSDQAHLYSATFYRATTAIALGLPRGADVTVEGYPRAGDQADKRLDTFAVLALHQYPGKPSKQVGEGVT